MGSKQLDNVVRLRSISRQTRASSQTEPSLRKALTIFAERICRGDTILGSFAVIRFEGHRVAVAAPDISKTERTLAQRGRVEREDG